MKLSTRLFTFVIITGVVCLIASQSVPGVTLMFYPATGNVTNTYFLVPTTVTITISTLNNPARLILAELNEDLSESPPLVNVSVVSKDIVSVFIPSRGWYVLNFTATTPGSVLTLSYTLTEAGGAQDLVQYGVILCLLGASLIVLQIMTLHWSKKIRSDLKSKSISA